MAFNSSATGTYVRVSRPFLIPQFKQNIKQDNLAGFFVYSIAPYLLLNAIQNACNYSYPLLLYMPLPLFRLYKNRHTYS